MAIKVYHAHVYFDQDSRQQAVELSDEAGRLFEVALGRIHDKPVGPHPCWSRQIAFNASIHDELVGWLEANRGDLTVFVHGLSGDDYADHTRHVNWLGEARTLKLDIFTRPDKD